MSERLLSLTKKKKKETEPAEKKFKLLEIDAPSNFLTNLGFDKTPMYKEADALSNYNSFDELNKSNLGYYKQLFEKKEQLTVRFTGFRQKTAKTSDELFVLREGVELVYPIERLLLGEKQDIAQLIEKEYKVYIRKIDEVNNKVILADTKESIRRQATEIIREKLEKGEEVYLRGNIIGLQRNGGSVEGRLAAYVNIEGLGIIGVIPVKWWSVGYTALSQFHETVENNANAIVNFRVTSETSIRSGNGKMRAFVCSRADYLTKIGYNPWQIAKEKFPLRSILKLRIVETGKDRDSFFGAVDGITDFNAICYVNDKSDIRPSDIIIGNYYYGFVQKVDIEDRYFRVRLTSAAEQGSEIRKSLGDKSKVKG